MSATILIIDDDAAVTGLLRTALGREGFDVLCAGSLGEAQRAYEAHAPEIVLVDHQLPDGTALDFLTYARGREERARIVVLTAHGSIPLAVEAIKLGAEQFLTKPVELASLKVLIHKLVERGREARRDQAYRYADRKNRPDPFLGTSRALRTVEEVARSVARSSVPVFIRGETGCGKGVLARWLHQESDRADESFVDLNCAGLSRELVESELFGHKKGAFTGATADRMGLLELADRGTLFLDEIGDLDISVQPKLLKALEDKTFRRLGAVQERRVDVRLITATHKDLVELTTRGAFRNDLLFRINTVTIELPPLRERREDIVPLARDILSSLASERGRQGVFIGAEAERALTEYDWPGNARELRNVLERALLFSTLDELRPSSLMLTSPRQMSPTTELSRSSTLADREKELVLAALKEASGDVPATARRLGIPRSSLYAKLKRWGVRPKDA